MLAYASQLHAATYASGAGRGCVRLSGAQAAQHALPCSLPPHTAVRDDAASSCCRALVASCGPHELQPHRPVVVRTRERQTPRGRPEASTHQYSPVLPTHQYSGSRQTRRGLHKVRSQSCASPITVRTGRLRVGAWRMPAPWSSSACTCQQGATTCAPTHQPTWHTSALLTDRSGRSLHAQ